MGKRLAKLEMTLLRGVKWFIGGSVLLMLGLYFLSVYVEMNSAKKCCCGSPQRKTKQALETLMRSQQAHFLENGRFATSISSLMTASDWSKERRTDFDRLSEHYQILMQTKRDQIVFQAQAKLPVMDSYVGFVVKSSDPLHGDNITLSTLCESGDPGRQQLPLPRTPQSCPAGTIQVK